MITIIDVNRFNNTIEMYGLSTDTKPIDKFEFQGTNYPITNGSTIYEMDTKSVFMYDEENKQWLKQ